MGRPIADWAVLLNGSEQLYPKEPLERNCFKISCTYCEIVVAFRPQTPMQRKFHRCYYSLRTYKHSIYHSQEKEAISLEIYICHEQLFKHDYRYITSKNSGPPISTQSQASSPLQNSPLPNPPRIFSRQTLTPSFSPYPSPPTPSPSH